MIYLWNAADRTGVNHDYLASRTLGDIRPMPRNSS